MKTGKKGIIRIHPLLPVMAILAVAFHQAVPLFTMSAALLVHECAHMLCARILNVKIYELELMPLGGAARFENLYAQKPFSVAMIALAGPAVNGILLFLCICYAAWIAVPGIWLSCFFRANVLLLIFNLLPALPLDGGRALVAFLTIWSGERRAFAIGITGGFILIAFLLALCVWSAWQYAQINISFLLCAIYIAAALLREREAYLQSLGLILYDALQAKRGEARGTGVGEGNGSPRFS